MFSALTHYIFAYTILKDDKAVVVYDGKEGPGFKDVAMPSFSPDSKMISYLAMDDGKAYMVINDVKSEQFDEIILMSSV